MDEPLAIIRTFSNRLEAEMAKGALDAAGIEASIHTDDLGGLRPDLAMRAGVHLVVRQQDSGQASDPLGGAGLEASDDEPPDPGE